MKLNKRLGYGSVKVLGFEAFEALTPNAKEDKETIYISTLPAAQMLERGINSYYAPVIPRGSRFNSPDEIKEADLEIEFYSIHEAEEIKTDDPVVIVTRHQATLDILLAMYKNVTAVITGDATIEDIKNKSVVGVLPPALISECKRYKGFSINNYNAAKDGDLTTGQMIQRLIVNNTITIKKYLDHWEYRLCSGYTHFTKNGVEQQPLKIDSIYLTDEGILALGEDKEYYRLTYNLGYGPHEVGAENVTRYVKK